MYEVLIKALHYYSKQSSSLTNELIEPKKDQKKFDDDLLRLFRKDFELIPDRVEHVVNDMKDKIGSEARWDELPSFIRKNQEIITNSLSLYKRDLQELQKIPKSKGFGEVELPNIKNLIELIDRTAGQLNLKLS